jgi:hypothetical protein
MILHKLQSFRFTQTHTYLLRESQCAQGVLSPVPASSQDLITPNISQIESFVSQEYTPRAGVPGTPIDSPSKSPGFSPRVWHQTRQSTPSQDLNGCFTYPTPESAVDPDLENLHTKSNVPKLDEDQTPTQALYLTQPTVPLDYPVHLFNGCHDSTRDCAIAELHEQSGQASGGEDVPAASTATQTSQSSRSSNPHVCCKCGEAGHITHDCTSETSVAEFVPQPGNVEHRRTVREAAGRNTHFYRELVASPAASYADSEATTVVEDIINIQLELLTPSADDFHLRTLAEQLLAQRNVGPNKPEPRGLPEVWAEGRQELCETLHYYRAYQSACYSTGGFARGFMFDQVAHSRDYVDTNVVISRAGGYLIKDNVSSEMKAGKDQTEDAVSQGLRNCMVHNNPVVLLTGVGNPHVPSKPPHQYCVLDYFKPTHIWVEKSGDSKILRYRFEKLNTKKESWWQPMEGKDVVELGSLPPPVVKKCEACGVESPQIYLNIWMCLSPVCASFWKIVTPVLGPGHSSSCCEPQEASLIYDPRFLKQKTIWDNDDHEYPLVSNTAELSAHSVPGEDTSVAFWSGIVCPKYGRCISRLNWMGWECSNTACDYTRRPPHTLITALSMRDPLWPVTNSYTLARDTQSSLIKVKVSFKYGYRIIRYYLPDIDGCITHMIANKTVLEEEGGPDAMFEELQHTDIGLRRRSMPDGQLKGPNYCRHFAVNYGMPYKFIAATESRSFEGAARPITSTRSHLNWAARLLLAEETGDVVEEVAQENGFNEVLALGYFEEQKINYHDDGEFGLGPTIAMLSLGAPGTMRIRMKCRRYHGISSAMGMYDDALPIPGCKDYEARLALQPYLDELKKSDPKAYTAKRKQIPKDLKLNYKGTAKDVLTMQLGHGDIVIMHGADVQKYYEHAVAHSGKLRFALTCRYIDPVSLKPADQPAYEVGRDTEEYDGLNLS